MNISLVLATFDRTACLHAFFRSVEGQPPSCKMEIIVVDQNADDRVTDVLRAYPSLKFKHLRSAKGLSRARNVGLDHVEGDIVAFPDDDCVYKDHTLERVVRLLGSKPEIDGISGRSCGADGLPSNGRWPDGSQLLDEESVWNCGISYTVFLRRAVIDRVGHFDPMLGVGAGTPWGSGEETDYLIRSLREGFKLMYEPSLEVIHEESGKLSGDAGVQKAFSYGCGMGRVLAKHQYPVCRAGYRLVRPLGGAVASLLSRDIDGFRRRGANFRGRLKGWLSRPRVAGM